MGTGNVVVGLANPAPRADKPDRINSRRRYASGLGSVGVVEFHILGRITAASVAFSDRILVRAIGDNCRKNGLGLVLCPARNAAIIDLF